MTEGAEAVRDGQDGASDNQFTKGVHDLCFSFDIQIGSWLVKEQDRCVTQDSASNSQTLLLTCGEVVALFTHDSIIAMGQTHNHIVNVGFFGSFDDFFNSSLWTSNLDIFTDGALKEDRIL